MIIFTTGSHIDGMAEEKKERSTKGDSLLPGISSSWEEPIPIMWSAGRDCPFQAKRWWATSCLSYLEAKEQIRQWRRLDLARMWQWLYGWERTPVAIRSSLDSRTKV
jgi:hypothetical protein